MNLNALRPGDPKLTAYALGELDQAEDARVADAIRQDPAAQAEVAAIRALAGELKDYLESEPYPLSTKLCVEDLFRAKPARGKLLRFPIYWAAGLAAACAVIVVTVRRPSTASTQGDQAFERSNASRPAASGDARLSGTRLPATDASPIWPGGESRGQGVFSEASKVNSAPLGEIGLPRWRSVTAADGAPFFLPRWDRRNERPAGVEERAPAYQSYHYVDALRLPKGAPASETTAARPSEHLLVAQYEVVPISTLEAAKVPENPTEADRTDRPALAPGDPRHGELLTLKIHYRRVPTIDLQQKIELPPIDTVANLAMTDESFKQAFAAARLDRKLREEPRKSETAYDQILTWTEDPSEIPAAGHEPRVESIDAVRKPRGPVVE